MHSEDGGRSGSGISRGVLATIERGGQLRNAMFRCGEEGLSKDTISIIECRYEGAAPGVLSLAARI